MAQPTRSIALHGAPGLALWLCPLHEWPAPEAQAWLDADELVRARRFVHEVHRRRHLASHVALRERLAALAGGAPAALRFTADAHGKPRLADAGDLQFNLSHSEDWALVGAGRGAPLGADIEWLRPVEEAAALARKHYTARERAAIDSAPDARSRDAVFLRVWTRKEACLKAVGLGLRLAPSSFETGAEEGPAIARLTTPAGEVAVEVRSIATGIDAVAAVARVLG